MKQIIIIVITLFYALIQLDAQNLDRLDKDNGFRKFILGSSFDIFKNELQPFKQVNPAFNSYRYAGEDSTLRDIAGVHPFEIHLLFDTTNSLISVALFCFMTNDGKAFEKKSQQMFEAVKKWFTDLYGSDYSVVQTDISDGILWETEKVELSVRMCYDKQMTWRQIVVSITKNRLCKK
jgi:hypothetical protein